MNAGVLAVTETPDILTATCPDCGKPISARADRRASGVFVGELIGETFHPHILAGCDFVRLSRALAAVAIEASKVRVFDIKP